MDVRTKIGSRIKNLRELANMSQKDLAYTADLDRSYIASVENGYWFFYNHDDPSGL